MIIYNVTVNIEDEVHEDWLHWMKEVHIPDVLDTGLIVDHTMARVLSRQAGETGHTYSIQYTMESMEALNTYREKHAPELQKEHTERYKDKFVAFRTLLEIV